MATKVDCSGYDIQVWKPEWSWQKFQDNFNEASLCEIGSLLVGAKKSAEEKVFSMAEAWAKKAAISYFDGISGGAFSLLIGSVNDPQSSLGVVVEQVDKIVARHFEEQYRRLFEDEKSSYFAAYNTYIQGTASFPFGAIVDKIHDPVRDVTELESKQYDHVIRSLEGFEATGSSLTKQGIFGRGVTNRFQAAGVFMLIVSQRLEVWKQLDFALDSQYARAIVWAINTLEQMYQECTNWLNERITSVREAKLKGSPVDGPDRGGPWVFSVDGDRRVFKLKQQADNERAQLIRNERNQIFGENHDRILSYWKEIAEMN